MFYIIDLNTNTKLPNTEFISHIDAVNWIEEFGNIIDYTIIEE